MVDELTYCPIDRVHPTYLVVSRTRPPLRAAELAVIEELADLVALREAELAEPAGAQSAQSRER